MGGDDSATTATPHDDEHHDEDHNLTDDHHFEDDFFDHRVNLHHGEAESELFPPMHHHSTRNLPGSMVIVHADDEGAHEEHDNEPPVQLGGLSKRVVDRRLSA